MKRLLIWTAIGTCALLVQGCASAPRQLQAVDFPTAERPEVFQCHAEALRFMDSAETGSVSVYNRMFGACLEGKGHVQIGAQ